MELTPAKLLVACAAIFGGIVAIGVVSQSRGTEELKFSLSAIDLSGLRQRLQKEEGIGQPEEAEPESEIVED